METFFEEEWPQDNMLCLEVDQVNQSAFLPYYSSPSCQIGMNNSSNINKRMIQFIRRSCTQSQESIPRCHRRKISERLRRQNERNGYLALHSMLPLGSKNDKKSIMQMAARRIEELKGYKEMLEKRKHDLEVKVDNANKSSSKIEVRVDNPTSSIDYIVEVLKCLNSLGVQTITIQSTLSPHHQLLAVFDIQTQIPVDEVRMAVQRTLQEVGMETSSQFPRLQVLAI